MTINELELILSLSDTTKIFIFKEIGEKLQSDNREFNLLKELVWILQKKFFEAGEELFFRNSLDEKFARIPTYFKALTLEYIATNKILAAKNVIIEGLKVHELLHKKTASEY